jgi:hypothetical protein
MQKLENGGQGDAPLGLLPPLGERGGHPPICCREKSINGEWDFNRAKKKENADKIIP